MSNVISLRRLAIADDRASELADVFRLLGDGSRLRIVVACLHASVSVTALAEQLDLSVSLVSHHLRLLKAARIVRAERRGKQVFYSAADHHIRRVITDMVEHLGEPNSHDHEEE
jgi:DNA-binding transcriptional ArsR family regulator